MYRFIVLLVFEHRTYLQCCSLCFSFNVVLFMVLFVECFAYNYSLIHYICAII